MTRFTARRAVVTGAASGIGEQLTRLLVAEGAHVVAADRTPAPSADQVIAVQADVADPDDMQRVIRTAEHELGGIDLLFNNAGIGSTTSVLDATVEEWDQVFAVNVRGTFLGIKYALPGMLAQGHGVITNTASAAGLVGLPDRAAYCASKGAVIALTKQVAIQWATAGIRCNSLCPGTVDSPWVQRLLQQAPDPAQRRSDLVARQPMGRLATPTEVAKAALYLASDDAAFVTGTNLIIDGGLLAG